MDDFFIGADNLDEANNLLSGLRDAIRHYQLDINETKTSILGTNLDLEPFWPVKIRREIEGFVGQNPKGKGSTAGHDFVYFLDEVVRIANSHSDDGVVKYALRKMDENELWNDYWHLVEPFLIRSAVNFPHCWDYVARIASWRHFTHGINNELWSDVVSKSLLRTAAAGNDSEVCWSLWLAKQAGLSVDLRAHELILEKCGAMSALLALDVFHSKAVQFKYPKAKLLDRVGDRPFGGENWLLGYEADRLFDYKLKTKNLNGFQFVEDLYAKDVEFYDVEAIQDVFMGVDNLNEVASALDGITSFYDTEYDGEEDEEDDPLF